MACRSYSHPSVAIGFLARRLPTDSNTNLLSSGLWERRHCPNEEQKTALQQVDAHINGNPCKRKRSKVMNTRVMCKHEKIFGRKPHYPRPFPNCASELASCQKVCCRWRLDSRNSPNFSWRSGRNWQRHPNTSVGKALLLQVFVICWDTVTFLANCILR